MAKADLTAARLRELLTYDPGTGIFCWRVQRSNVAAGTIAGNRRQDGYLDIRLDGKLYRSHRLAWLYMTGHWPANLIDHKDRNPSNTKWENLREATCMQNRQNQKIRKDSNNKYKGIERHSSGLWRARIRIHGKTIILGYFKTEADAFAARIDGEKTYFTHSPVCELQAENRDGRALPDAIQ